MMGGFVRVRDESLVPDMFSPTATQAIRYITRHLIKYVGSRSVRSLSRFLYCSRLGNFYHSSSAFRSGDHPPFYSVRIRVRQKQSRKIDRVRLQWSSSVRDRICLLAVDSSFRDLRRLVDIRYNLIRARQHSRTTQQMDSVLCDEKCPIESCVLLPTLLALRCE